MSDFDEKVLQRLLKLERELARLKVWERPAGWTVWTPTVTGWAAGYTAVCRYALVGKTCFFEVYVKGTSDNATTSITLPFTSATVTNFNWSGAQATTKDNGTILTTPGRWVVNPNSASLLFLKDMANGTLTASGEKIIRAQGFYEVA